MFTIELTKEPSLGFLFQIREDFREWDRVRGTDGKLILICHCTEGGGIARDVIDWLSYSQVDGILCCHPARAKQRYPHLPFIGEWEGKTFYEVKGKTLYYGPSASQG